MCRPWAKLAAQNAIRMADKHFHFLLSISMLMLQEIDGGEGLQNEFEADA